MSTQQEHAPDTSPSTDAPGAPADVAAGARALEFVQQFQTHLERLNAMADEQAQRAAALDAREAALQSLAKELEARQQREHGEARAPDELATLKCTLEQREETLRVLAERLLRAEEQAATHSTELLRAKERLAVAEAEAALGSSAPVSLGHESEPGSGFVMLRRARLSTYKTLLNQQAKKLMTAKAALQKKNAECEAVLAHRAKLAAASLELAAQKKAVAARMAKSQAASMTFAIVGVLGVVLALAWAIAGRVSPAFYAARAVLAADTKGVDPSKDELNAWTAAHERVLEDPELLQLAADRFASRGMPELANPTALGVRFRPGQDFTFMTDRAGALTLELRGQGADVTTRQLETFALAAVALANARRDVRGDGLPTMLSENAKVGSEPIRDDRLWTVLTLSAPGLAIAGVLGYGLYRVLQSSKRNFERHMAVVEATA